MTHDITCPIWQDEKCNCRPRTRFGPNDLNYPQAPKVGAVPVQWLIDGKWVHKGWLMPEIGGTNGH